MHAGIGFAVPVGVTVVGGVAVGVPGGPHDMPSW
jgi:hypothetical protein